MEKFFNDKGVQITFLQTMGAIEDGAKPSRSTYVAALKDAAQIRAAQNEEIDNQEECIKDMAATIDGAVCGGDLQHLSELIAEGKTDDALEFLYNADPQIVTHPGTTKYLAEIRSLV